MTAKEYIKEHPEQFKDKIDKWLFAECNIIGGCSSAQGSLSYSVARQVAEKLWNKPLWKDAQGDDLPEIDREVVVFTQDFPNDAGIMAVAVAHRPNPKGWDGKSISTGKVEHYTPKTYDKGGWNIPNVKYWLDCNLPMEEEL